MTNVVQIFDTHKYKCNALAKKMLKCKPIYGVLTPRKPLSSGHCVEPCEMLDDVTEETAGNARRSFALNTEAHLTNEN